MGNCPCFGRGRPSETEPLAKDSCGSGAGGGVPITLVVQTLTGAKEAVAVSATATVAQFRVQLQATAGPALVPASCRFIHEGVAMDNDQRTLTSYGVRAGSTVYIINRMRPDLSA